MMSLDKFSQLVKKEIQEFSTHAHAAIKVDESVKDKKIIADLELPPFVFQNVSSDFESNSLDYLLSLHDHVFINEAFMSILNRPADQEAMDYYLSCLRSGKFDKLGVLSRIIISSEARRVRTNIIRIPKFKLLFSLLKQVPVFGWLLRWIHTFVTLPNVQKQINENLAHTIALNVHLQSYLRDISGMIEDAHNALSEDYVQKSNEQKCHNDTVLILGELNQALTCKSNEIKALSAQLFEIQEKSDECFLELREELTALKSETSSNVASNSQSVSSIKKELEAYKNTNRAEISDIKLQLEETYKNQENTQVSHKVIEKVSDRLLTQEGISENLKKEVADLGKELKPLLSDYGAKKEIENLKIPHSFYSDFEDRFRGSREEITQRLQFYIEETSEIDELKSFGALDLACGRGEWLGLLRENGFRARGVDINQATNDACLELGLDVETADIFEYLQRQPENSVGLISAFHIVEHLPFELLFQVLIEIHRVLVPNGVVILETPNPGNLLVGACNFYIDPTHRNPLPSPLLEFLVEHQGFNAKSIPLNPCSDLGMIKGFDGAQYINNLLFGSRDYAVIGRKL
ncbi:class I SAM-dependent methyltransferase [Pseudoalteromonas piratica]|uniref:class I SAM-dependent methyltransferase n=1 Tax=Pseudoalteromonas piratica TaxID=1348114 RepID=UPI00069011CC|nr:class I SAM-dependent methyltransferase [Pseudoalteromonas piratica]